VTENITLLLRAHSWFSEYNLAHAGEIRTDLSHGIVWAHEVQPGSHRRAPSSGVCNYPNSHNIGGTRCHWGQGPWASARVLVTVIARLSTNDEMSVVKFT